MTLFQKIFAENTVFNTLSGEKLLAFVEVILSPLQSVRDAYDSYIAAKRYELSFNGQVIYLEHVLNDTFDNTLRRIYLSEPSNLGAQSPVVYNFSDDYDSMTVYNFTNTGSANTPRFYNTADLTIQYDFILNLPFALSTKENAIKKLLDAYKEASKKYQVTYG